MYRRLLLEHYCECRPYFGPPLHAHYPRTFRAHLVLLKAIGKKKDNPNGTNVSTSHKACQHFSCTEI